MRFAAYQFGVTGDVQKNMEIIRKAVERAADQKAELIVFPECAISGYPPRNIDKACDIDQAAIKNAINELEGLSDIYKINVIVGTVFCEDKYYNRAHLF